MGTLPRTNCITNWFGALSGKSVRVVCSHRQYWPNLTYIWWPSKRVKLMWSKLMLSELSHELSLFMQHYVWFKCPKLPTRQFVPLFIPLNTF